MTSEDRARRLRELAKRYHPDAHPNAAPKEKAELARRFAEERAKLEEPSPELEAAFAAFFKPFWPRAKGRKTKRTSSASPPPRVRRVAERDVEKVRRFVEQRVLIRLSDGDAVHVAFSRMHSITRCGLWLPQGAIAHDFVVDQDTPAMRALASDLCPACDNVG